MSYVTYPVRERKGERERNKFCARFDDTRTFKGTVLQDFLSPFFMKHILLVPMNMLIRSLNFILNISGVNYIL